MSNWIKNYFEDWVFQSFEVTAEGLALYRIFSALFFLLFMLPPLKTYDFMGGLPAMFYHPPPGLMQLFGGFLPEVIFIILHGLLILSLICLGLGYGTKVSSISAGLIFLILKGFIFSMGKVNHEMLLIVMPIVMAFSGWGKAYSIDTKRVKASINTHAWPLALLGLIMGFMFFTAGFPKILGGWLDLHTQAAYSHFLKDFIIRNRHDLLAPLGWEFSRFLWEIADYATVFFEVGFLAAVFHGKSTRIFVSLAILFHLSIMLLLNISFMPHFVVYAAFIDWKFVDKKARSGFQSLSNQPNPWWAGPALVVSSLVGVVVLSWCLSGWHILASDWGVRGFLIVLSAVPIALFYLGKQVLRVLKRGGAQ